MKDLKNLAKQLRKEQTIPEQIIWHVLRNRSFCNKKFRRQVQIANYIVDFVCYDLNLIIELDGGQHLSQKKLEYDKKRTEILEDRGFKVIRYYNNDVLNNLDAVLEDLYDKLN